MRRLRDQASGPATLISHGCKISGSISGDGDFQIILSDTSPTFNEVAERFLGREIPGIELVSV